MARAPESWKLSLEGGVWFVRFTHQGIRVHRSTRERAKGAAKKSAARIYAEALARGVKRRSRPTGDLEDLLSEWLVSVSETRSKEWHATLEVYSSAHWLPRWGRLEEITGPAVQAYISDRLRAPGRRHGTRVSPVTLAKELSGLRTFLRWCQQRGFILELPTWIAPEAVSDHVPITLTREQVAAIIAELPSRDRHPRRMPVRAWFAVMWATSLRAGALARLRWEDVDLERGTVVVRASTDKKRFQRELPLTPEAIAELKALAPGVGLVFGRHDYRDTLRSAARRSGLTEEVANQIAGHAFRHARLTDFASRSKNVAAIQFMAGHKDLHSTQRYVRGSLEGARAMLEEVDGTTSAGDSGRNSGRDEKKAPGHGA